MFPRQSTGRKFLLIIIMALLIAGVAVAAVYMAGPAEEEMTVVNVNAEAVEIVKTHVRNAQGQPIEGFEPGLLMRTFKGLEVTDFQGVQAVGGVYHVMAGTLQLARTNRETMTSADEALTDIGIMQMLNNAARRLSVPTATTGNYNTLIMIHLAGAVYSVNPDGTQPDTGTSIQQQKTVTGEFVCLPHRDTSGPQTMECAFGIHDTVAKKYYALSFNNIPDEEWQSIEMRAVITVQGAFVPGEALSTNMWQIYPIEGIIEVKSLSKPVKTM